VLAFRADVATKLAAAHSGSLANPVVNRDEQMMFVITITLITLAALTVIFTAWASVIDARHASALMRALGATPRQVRSGLAQAQILAALPGAILGVPLGLGLFKAVSKGDAGAPAGLWLVATVCATVAMVAVLTTIPAHIGTRRSVAAALQAETA
jgi:ABC-type antimicrobial peptide transport system permease subunit